MRFIIIWVLYFDFASRLNELKLKKYCAKKQNKTELYSYFKQLIPCQTCSFFYRILQTLKTIEKQKINNERTEKQHVHESAMTTRKK